ncbi:MAG: DUF354 domain-containing protein [Candidatus Helarchaeota archaeon]|nr:DUF354 domain-containing protein [Candidatus Helarchaeota archaeon]
MPKIWIDITTPKQVMFFNRLIKIFRKRNYKVLVTSRNYFELNRMLDAYKIKARIVGKHGGKSLKGKLQASLNRAMQLLEIISEEKPDLLVSLTSDVAARIAFGLQIPHISTSDSPFAMAVNKLSIPFVTKLLVPKAINLEEWLRFGISVDDIISYDAVDAVAWIKYLQPNTNVLKELNLNKEDLIILLRPEEAYAAYVLDWEIEEPVIYPTIRKILENFPNAKLIILPRYEEQLKLFKQDFPDEIIIPEKVIDVPSLLTYTSLMMGFAGTINQEAAILGVPTVSFRPVPLWCDYYLEKRGLLYIAKSPDDAADISVKILKDRESSLIRHKELARKALQEMDDPIEILADMVFNYLKQVEK